jgi:hypothetical protein
MRHNLNLHHPSLRTSARLILVICLSVLVVLCAGGSWGGASAQGTIPTPTASSIPSIQPPDPTSTSTFVFIPSPTFTPTATDTPEPTPTDRPESTLIDTPEPTETEAPPPTTIPSPTIAVEQEDGTGLSTGGILVGFFVLLFGGIILWWVRRGQEERREQ